MLFCQLIISALTRQKDLFDFGKVFIEFIPSFKTKFLHVSKISFNKRYLLHTYDCYTSIATPEKRNELTLGHLYGPWTELTLNSPSV